MDVASRQRSLVLEDPRYDLGRARFSPDQKWIAFNASNAPDAAVIFIAPFRGFSPIPREQWIQVTKGEAVDAIPRWSPDGGLLYFVSYRDGYECLYTQRLEPATRKPIGEATHLKHLNGARRSLSSVFGPWQEISVARDKVVFPLNERTGNIWMRERIP